MESGPRAGRGSSTVYSGLQAAHLSLERGQGAPTPPGTAVADYSLCHLRPETPRFTPVMLRTEHQTLRTVVLRAKPPPRRACQKTLPLGPGFLACPLPRLTPLECEYPACLQLCSWLQQLLSKYLPREGTGRRPAEPQPPRKAQDPLGKSKACRYAHHPLLPHPSWKHCSPS